MRRPENSTGCLRAKLTQRGVQLPGLLQDVAKKAGKLCEDYRIMALLGIVAIVIGLWLTDWLRRILMGDE